MCKSNTPANMPPRLRKLADEDPAVREFLVALEAVRRSIARMLWLVVQAVGGTVVVPFRYIEEEDDSRSILYTWEDKKAQEVRLQAQRYVKTDTVRDEKSE